MSRIERVMSDVNGDSLSFPGTRHPVQVRVWWENESGHTFDEVHQYLLVCTLDRDEKERLGYAFTFIRPPSGWTGRDGPYAECY